MPNNTQPKSYLQPELFAMPLGPQTPFNTLAQLRTNDIGNLNNTENQSFVRGCVNAFSTLKKRKKRLSTSEKLEQLQRKFLIAKEVEKKIQAIPAGRAKLGSMIYLNKREVERERSEKRALNAVYKRKTIHQLRKKIRDKHFSYEIVMNLLLHNPGSELKYSYLNTLNYCQSEYKQEGKVLSSKYCNNRFCYSCNKIRTGKMINNYLPVIQRMDDLYFVTLTIPNCKQDVLKQKIRGMIQTFQLIKDAARKRFERGTGEKFSGIRKLECTYNQKRNDYHPHFHIVVKGLESATAIVEDWLMHYPEAVVEAQDVRPATLNSVKELFKYFTKFWNSKQDKQRELKPVDYVSLNNIFCSIRGLRIFQPFGLDEYKIDESDSIESEDIQGLQKQVYNIPEADCNYKYTYEAFNFIDYETGAAITDFKFSRKDVKIFTDLLGYDGVIPLPVYSPIKRE